MIKINNEIYRNIQEQVQANKDAIEAFSNVEFTLNNFGITVLGKVDYVSDIPESDIFSYGDAYLVGLYEPYNLYIYTRTDSNTGTFINIGPINIVGQEGPAGPVGPAGRDGYAPVVRYGNGLPVTEPTDKKGYIYIDQLTSRLYTFDNGWNFVINMQGPKGDQGNQGIQGATGTTLSIVGKLASPSLLPTNFASGSIPKNSAYLVDVNGANHLYIILGNQSDYSTWYWQDAGDFNLGSVIYKDSVFQSAINITDNYNTNTGAVVTDTATNKLNNDLQTIINTKVAYSDFEDALLLKADSDNVVTPTELNSAIDSTTNTLNTNINNVKSELTGLINGKQDKLNGSQTNAINSGITSGLVSQITRNKKNISSINLKIPTQASATNQLADKDFVNSSLNSIAAYFITKNAAGESFATKAELTSATTFYSGGEVRVPTRNDYCIVAKDEDHDNATTRYIYNNSWEYQYTINETPLTAEQLAAINSGITADLVTEFGNKQTALNQTQMNAINSGITASLVDTFSKKQNALTTSQLAAVNSGITQSLVSTFNQKTTTKVNGAPVSEINFTSDPQTQIGNLNSLATTDKTSLVNAINEVKNGSAGLAEYVLFDRVNNNNAGINLKSTEYIDLTNYGLVGDLKDYKYINFVVANSNGATTFQMSHLARIDQEFLSGNMGSSYTEYPIAVPYYYPLSSTSGFVIGEHTILLNKLNKIKLKESRYLQGNSSTLSTNQSTSSILIFKISLLK